MRSETFSKLCEIPKDGRPLHLAVGMFDGVHRGHRLVIDSAVRAAREDGGRIGVMTFWPHPSHLFRPEDPVPMISNPEIKHWLLEDAGVHWIIQIPFDAAFAEISAERFVRMMTEAMPGLRGIYIGENFRFGKGRQGSPATFLPLEKELGIEVVSAERLRFNGEAISSTRIRAALQAGRLGEANRMLGYPYFSLGKVESGNQIGRGMGIPTLNLPWDPECKPAFGVYLVRVRYWNPEDDEHLRGGVPGVANYGYRPTVGDLETPLLEVHLLESGTEWHEGSTLKVEWLDFIRPERKFDSLEALRTQIEKDREKAEAFFRV